LFSTHKLVHILHPYLSSYVRKMIKVTEGAEGIQIYYKEHYARSVFSRAVALQNAYDTLNLSIEYLDRADFASSSFDFEKHYQYHLEHFYLSVFGIIDRCYLLVGTSIMLTDSEIDKLGSVRTIESRLGQLESCSKILDALRILKLNQENLRATRNAIAHKNGFTNDHIEALEFFSIASDFQSKFPDEFKLDEAEEIIRNGLKKKTKKEIDLIHTTLKSDVENVFHNLEFLYNGIGEIEMMNKVRFEY